ncbi:neutral zinc metallopeptidase, partial [Staphylococcus aureus]|uniref:neutral zinc metallopeptidase n=1 Tax=Staphylococcus aureus TaxID=1280 RepID=UPI003D0F56C0
IGIIILLLNVFGGETGQTVGNVLQQMQGGQQQTEAAAPLSKEDEEMGHFVKSVLAKTEDTWMKKFAEQGITYKKPK